MQIEGSTILVTGANRGIARALVEAVLSRGAARVYAGTRVPFQHADERVVPLQIDVTDRWQVAGAAARVEQLAS
jgi:NAD(P)-dependent dehydrogenase (short-subunit alcohol dehydrogenase family)